MSRGMSKTVADGLDPNTGLRCTLSKERDFIETFAGSQRIQMKPEDPWRLGAE